MNMNPLFAPFSFSILISHPKFISQSILFHSLCIQTSPTIFDSNKDFKIQKALLKTPPPLLKSHCNLNASRQKGKPRGKEKFQNFEWAEILTLYVDISFGWRRWEDGNGWKSRKKRRSKKNKIFEMYFKLERKRRGKMSFLSFLVSSSWHLVPLYLRGILFSLFHEVPTTEWYCETSVIPIATVEQDKATLLLDGCFREVNGIYLSESLNTCMG